MTCRARWTGRAVGLAILAALLTWPVGADEITRVSVDDAGASSDGTSRNLAISKDGRFVCFHSDATNLVAGDTNGERDIFVHDRKKGRTTRVSVSSTGEQANGHCEGGGISANGRYVVFYAAATNLVPDDTNGFQDVFLHDRKKGRTTRISRSFTGGETDGNLVRPSISEDGRFISFRGEATNVVPDDTNGVGDVFLHDRKKRTTTRVSVSSTGDESDQYCMRSALSGNGRVTAMQTLATTLVADDTNGEIDVFLHDRKKGTTTRISVGPGGVEGNGESGSPACSRKGRLVVFLSRATNLAPGDTNGAQDVFLHDVKKGATVRLLIAGPGDQADGDCFNPALSPDGRYVAFDSDATNLVAGDTNGVRDLFLHDRKKGTTVRLSVSASGDEADGNSHRPFLTKKAKVVVFFSGATNLVPGDTNGVADVFVIDRRR